MLNRDLLKNNLNVLYVIPSKAIGGAEFLHDSYESMGDFNYVEKYCLNFDELSFKSLFCSLKHFLKVVDQRNPDLIVCSLWKSHLVILLGKLFFKKYQIIPFYHSSSFRSIPDQIISRLILKFSKAYFVDSNSAKEFISRFTRKNGYILSSFTRSDLKETKQRNTPPNQIRRFIFIGRIHPVKNIEESIELLMQFARNKKEEVIFDIYGPQHYSLRIPSKLTNLKISINDPVCPSKITELILSYDCFIQTSLTEGFSIIAKKALKAGQICVLTPVGDLNSISLKGAFLSHTSIPETVNSLNRLDYVELVKIINKAKNSFQDYPCFSQTFDEALTHLSEFKK